VPDMYDKLGDLLNEALNSGTIPKNSTKEEIKDQVQTEENADSGLFSSKNTEKKDKIKVNFGFIHNKNELNDKAQVIKMYKYTKIIQYPAYIQSALDTLDVAYPVTAKKIKQKYHLLLKKTHPDTKNTIQNSDLVYKNRQLTINQIQEAYKTLCTYFNTES